MSNMAVDVFARTLALASLGNGSGGSAVDTYTKAEINKMFSEAGTVQVEAVDALPTEDIKENVIYLVPNGSSGENFYDECMYINNKWETIGTTEVDLSNYVTKEELETALADKITQDVLAAYATKKYVDDSIAAIEIPSIDGLATEEYADAVGQKAFDDMAAIAGDINDLTTETHETFTAAINEINAKVDNIEIPSTEGLATEEYVNNAVANATGNVNVFEGTQEEYDALSDEEKAKYTIVVIDDGEEV